MSSIRLPRRQFLALGAAGLGGTLLTGCDRLSESSDVQEGLSSAEWLTYRVQRLLGGRHALAREFAASDVSPVFKVNGSHMPEGEEYAALLESNFADWRLRVDGLVAKPLQLSLADLRNLPQRTQITRHDCVEGWRFRRLQTSIDQIIEERPPGRLALSAHVLDRQQNFLAVLPDDQRHEKRNRRGLLVEPHPHHCAVENEPDDWLVLQGARVPIVPIAFHLAPNSADRVLPHGAAKQSRKRPAHPARVSPGKIGAGNQRVGQFRAPLVGRNGRVLPSTVLPPMFPDGLEGRRPSPARRFPSTGARDDRAGNPPFLPPGRRRRSRQGEAVHTGPAQAQHRVPFQHTFGANTPLV
jgi:hypothetical protein